MTRHKYLWRTVVDASRPEKGSPKQENDLSFRTLLDALQQQGIGG